MATLAATDIHANGTILVAGLTTFASPRVGNQAYANWTYTLPFESFRITHYSDPVPHVPPVWAGFIHVN